ncbi:hypothetical protein Cgig2_001643 [Carnegiea gigantea]|uniref:Reverse transcriptase zinc-binding domain-containing protein n=1 Tax=Carnegiea gigantea TaxID=171969 RepID=A0A9Q1GFC3_9CARY|nr:hypothetical protein Cgig2_001643 [Carnegiea gigantea]
MDEQGHQVEGFEKANMQKSQMVFGGTSQQLVILINSVLFGMYSYWASIFILPAEVVEKITMISRNFLWSGAAKFKRVPHLSWQQACFYRSQGGPGIKDYAIWNKALIAKLVWALAHKKDTLWVRWVHGRYLKNQLWWSYSPLPDNSEKDKVNWAMLVWARTVIPRHAFIVWVLIQHRLPTKTRLAKIAKIEKTITCAVITVAIYHIWSSRNQVLFDSKQIPGSKTVHLIKDQVKHRIVHMNKILGKYSRCIDRLLQ